MFIAYVTGEMLDHLLVSPQGLLEEPFVALDANRLKRLAGLIAYGLLCGLIAAELVLVLQPRAASIAPSALLLSKQARIPMHIHQILGLRPQLTQAIARSRVDEAVLGPDALTSACIREL